MLPDPQGSAAGTMKLLGGDPCLDFVNTVGGRVADAKARRARVRDDKLGAYPDLVAFGLHVGLLARGPGRRLLRLGRAHPRAARAALEQALALREALYRALHALMQGRPPFAADLEVLNTELLRSRRHEVLAARGGGIRWEWRGPKGALQAPLWPVVRAAATLMTSSELTHLRQCGGQGCGWLFLDRSRNRRRRWCSMDDCGNLDKVRRFRRRQARR